MIAFKIIWRLKFTGRFRTWPGTIKLKVAVRIGKSPSCKMDSIHTNTTVGSIESVPQLLLQVQRHTCGSPMYKYMMNKRYSRGLTPGARSMVVGRRGKAIRESG